VALKSSKKERSFEMKREVLEVKGKKGGIISKAVLLIDEESRLIILLLAGPARKEETASHFEKFWKDNLPSGEWNFIVDLEYLSSPCSLVLGILGKEIYYERKLKENGFAIFTCGANLKKDSNGKLNKKETFYKEILFPLIYVQGVEEESFKGSLEQILIDKNVSELLRRQAMRDKFNLEGYKPFSPEIDIMRETFGVEEITKEVAKAVLDLDKRLREGALRVPIKGGDNLLVLTAEKYLSAIYMWLERTLRAHKFFDAKGDGKGKIDEIFLSYLVNELFTNSRKSYGDSDKGIIFIYLIRKGELLYLVWEDHGGIKEYKKGGGMAQADIHTRILKMYSEEEVLKFHLGLKTDLGMTKPSIPLIHIIERERVAEELLIEDKIEELQKEGDKKKEAEKLFLLLDLIRRSRGEEATAKKTFQEIEKLPKLLILLDLIRRSRKETLKKLLEETKKDEADELLKLLKLLKDNRKEEVVRVLLGAEKSEKTEKLIKLLELFFEVRRKYEEIKNLPLGEAVRVEEIGPGYRVILTFLLPQESSSQ